jgi:hypothetical protein
MMEELKYPIGNFKMPLEISAEDRSAAIRVIEDFPIKIIALTENLSAEVKAQRYRPDGWCISQLVHHCADSHLNAFIRFKWTLTEEKPSIKPYLEAKWAELSDSLNPEIGDSLHILQGLHARWSYLLKNLNEDDWNRSYYHPESQREFSLQQALMLYKWHAAHHTAHIENALTNPY